MAVQTVTDGNYEAKVLKSSLPVLVDFQAEWCGPCKMAEPVLEELSKVYKGKVSMVKMDVDENKETPVKYNILSIPTTIIIKEGKETGRQVGFAGKKAYEELLKKGVS